MLHTRSIGRASFWTKAAVAVLLVGLVDALFLFHLPGATVGAFALAWIAGVLLVRPGLLRDRRAVLALGAAAPLALVLFDRPGPLAWLLFGLALTVAVLSARVREDDHAWRWSQRLVVHGLIAVAGPVIDLIQLLKSRGRRRTGSLRGVLGMLALPLLGGVVFLSLFASANPLIADMLDRVRVPGPSAEGVFRIWCWVFALLIVGSTLRPRWRRRLLELPSFRAAGMPGVSSASIVLSLVVFNAVFALQNGLDVVFLWSGAPLPGDIGLADYAHKGAYTLIATALLAGLFVLVVLRPGSETARKPLVRGLVVAWIAQNMLLVASSMLRTADYIESYALTRFRIAALVWMIMVAIGLGLICWRLLKDRDGHWLIDANVRLVLVVLAILSVVDLGAIAAAWNVRHAREAGGRGVELDLGYLRSLGAPALVSLVELERTTDDPEFRDRVASVRAEVLAGVRRDQAEWRGWTWRNARRLDRVAALAAERPLVRPRPGERLWDGSLAPSPPPATLEEALPPPAPLTSSPGV